jgi:hypothetical protein
MNSLNKNHWSAHANQWSKVTSPLRPHASDISLMKKAVENNHGTCLLFGVTPEIASSFSPLIAIDNNLGMIEKLWNTGINAKAIHANWLDIPLERQTIGYAIGDGSINMLLYDSQYKLWFEQINKVLIPEGRLIIRVFARPAHPESLSLVRESALSGSIGNFHAFKWRWAMALVGMNKNPNIRVTQILESFNEYFPNRHSLSEKANWPIDDIDTIDVYTKSEAIYSFPTLDEVRSTISGNFIEVATMYGEYELSDRCPIVVIQKK